MGVSHRHDQEERMGVLPPAAEEALESALVSELTVVGADGCLVSYPLIPLYDGELVHMTSSVLFSRKLAHIKDDPRVAVTVSDPVAAPALERLGLAGVTVRGRARVVEDDLHEGWMRLLPLWQRKEPAIERFVKQRFAIPLFFERSVIEIEPVGVVLWWRGGRAERHVVSPKGAAA
jgi:hypothetical protein